MEVNILAIAAFFKDSDAVTFTAVKK